MTRLASNVELTKADFDLNGVILLTNKGMRIFVGKVCSNGARWTRENAFKYCNSDKSSFINEHQASKLEAISQCINEDIIKPKDWYKDINNFIEVELRAKNHPLNMPRKYQLSIELNGGEYDREVIIECNAIAIDPADTRVVFADGIKITLDGLVSKINEVEK